MKRKIIYLFITALFLSCKTQPAVKIGEDAMRKLMNIGEFGAFADGGLLYLSVDAVNARPILDLLTIGGAAGKDAAQILDRTSAITAVLYPTGSDQRFFAVFQGNYPKTMVDLLLKVSADWKKQRSEIGADYWRAEKNRLSVVFNEETIAASDADPFSFVSNAVPVSVPQGFDEFRQGAIMAGWSGNDARMVQSFLTALEMPFEIQAEGLFFSVTSKDDGYYTTLQLKTPSENAARGLFQLFSMARLLGAGEMMVEGDLGFFMNTLFSNPPERNGAFLTLRLGAMNAAQTALLFNIFSDYPHTPSVF
jgi:hypothetical protein